MNRRCAALVAMAVAWLLGCGAPDLNPNTSPTRTTHGWFPIGAASRHATVDCNAGHGQVDTFQKFHCVTSGCHDAASIDPQHAQVGGYTYQSPQCLKCHADSQASAVANHVPFQIQSGARHYEQACLVCHPHARTDKPFGEDFTTFDCITACHPNAHNQGQGPMGCIKCHANGTSGG